MGLFLIYLVILLAYLRDMSHISNRLISQDGKISFLLSTEHSIRESNLRFHFTPSSLIPPSLVPFDVLILIRGIRTIAKFRLLTKIDFNVMHLINLSKKIWQKLQIRGSRGLQNSAISDTFFQFLTILCSKNASNWFWSTKFAYRRKKITKNSYQNSLQL